MPKNVYYSVGQNTTDHKTGSPTIAIVGGVATFSVAQTATNLGVGDRVTYDSSAHICYLASKISTTSWNVVTALGVAPAEHIAVAVDSIAHEYTSLSAAEAGAADANHLNTTNLPLAGFILNIPCYYDSATDGTPVSISGWNTDADYYINVYTPRDTTTECNQTQRHIGVWDATKYSITGLTTSGYVINPDQSYTRIMGLQINNPYNGDDGNYAPGVYSSGTTIVGCVIAYNIIKKTTAAGSATGTVGIYFRASCKLYNNTIYDYRRGIDLDENASSQTFIVYNNTCYNCAYYGFSISMTNYSGHALYLKNNISQNAGTADYYVVDGGQTYVHSNNISKDTSSPDTSYISKTVTFHDVTNKDFRLSIRDTVAKGLGADLSSDAQLPFSDDIKSQSRRAYWDIGADQTPTNVYYSVGQNTTDHSSGGNVSITTGVATFTVAQTAVNLGVGDRLTAGGNAYYLASKTSSTVWNVITKLGAFPSNLGSTAVTSIAHEYTSLSAAEAGAIDANHLNTTDLVAGGFALNIPCYYDSAADTTAVSIDGWTVGTRNYIKIYTPYNTTTECNQTQRHSGVWSDTKYNLVISNGPAIEIFNNYLRFDGLQIRITSTSDNSQQPFRFWNNINGAHDIRISNCIARGYSSSTNNYHCFMDPWGSGVGVFYVWNNIIYDFKSSGTNCGGIIFEQTNSTLYAYNNTFQNCDYGIVRTDGVVTAKNNIIKGSGNTRAYVGTFTNSDYNATDGTDTGDGGANSRISQTFTFIDEVNDDFRLDRGDAGARNYGINLSGDSVIPFSTDIENKTRPMGSAWDIGASEATRRRIVINSSL